MRAARPTTIATLVALAACAGCARGRARAAGPAAAAAPVRAGPLAEGDARRRAGDLEGAAAAYEAAVRADPAFVPAHLRWVAAATASGRRQRVVEAYAARAKAPGATEADRVTAARLASDGSDDALRAVYDDAIRRSPGNAWWRLGRAEVELAAASAALEAGREADASGDRSRGDEERARARTALAAAREALAVADRLAPGRAEVAMYRGAASLVGADLAPDRATRGQEQERALSAFGRAVAIDPALVEGWAGLADARSRAGEEGEALLAWIAAIRLAPNDASLRLGAAATLRALDRPFEAAVQLRAAAVLRPRDPEPLVAAGDALALAWCHDGALALYAEALRRDPGSLAAHRGRAEVLAHLGRAAEARAALAAYVAAGGEDEEGLRRRLERLEAARR